MKLVLQTDADWIACGLSKVVFDEKADTSLLKNYYTAADSLNMLGLSAVRFSPFWNTTEELKIAEQTAASLAGYVLEHHGLDVLLCGVDDKIKTDWLRSIGVNREFTYDYGELLNRFSYSSSKEYPLIAKCDTIM